MKRSIQFDTYRTNPHRIKLGCTNLLLATTSYPSGMGVIANKHARSVKLAYASFQTWMCILSFWHGCRIYSIFNWHARYVKLVCASWMSNSLCDDVLACALFQTCVYTVHVQLLSDDALTCAPFQTCMRIVHVQLLCADVFACMRLISNLHVQFLCDDALAFASCLICMRLISN